MTSGPPRAAATGLAPAVTVVGTGALASALAARLARAGEARVTVTGTWTEALRTIGAHGIHIQEPGGSYVDRPQTRALGAPVVATDRAEIAVVAVKSPQTRVVAPAVAALVRPDGLVVTVQNGLGNREVLAEAIGADRVALGVATLGTTLLGPGEVRFFPGRFELGAEPMVRARVERFAALLRQAGLETTLSPDIRPAQWLKLAANCAINPLTALHRCLNGALLHEPDRLRRLEQAAREVGAVAQALGIALGRDAAEHTAEVARLTAANRSSMLQDVERGRPTEIDALCGAVVAEGERSGVPTPVIRALWCAVRELEGRPVDAGRAIDETVPLP